MEARLTPAPPAAGRLSWWLAFAVLTAAAFAVRAPWFGNPVIHVDEDFYLLVGDRMLHGAVPFVDIFDRKPVGLFLIYAAIRLLGGDGIVQYQAVATLFAAATAAFVARMGSRLAGPVPGLVAGVIYLLFLNLIGGEGGQSPVFYNLPMIAAASLVLAAWLSGDPRRNRWLGAGAMALVGIALQIKYTAVFEGVGFGLMLLWRGWRLDPRAGPRLADAAIWVALALLPTAAAWGWYAAHGFSAEFVFANFTSIQGRAHEAARKIANRLGWSFAGVAPLLLVVLLSEWILTSWRVPWRERERGADVHRFALLWFAAAWGGYFLFGTYFDHYMLPLLPPTAVLAAPMFAHRRRFVGLAFALFLIAYGFGGGAIQRHRNIKMRGDAAYIHRIVDLVRPRAGGGVYVFDGEPMIYYLSGAAIPTRWAFPNHLNMLREAPAIGVDPMKEVTRIFATHPRVVIDTEIANDDINPRTQALARGILKRDYRVLDREVLSSEQARVVYERLPGR